MSRLSDQINDGLWCMSCGAKIDHHGLDKLKHQRVCSKCEFEMEWLDAISNGSTPIEVEEIDDDDRPLELGHGEEF